MITPELIGYIRREFAKGRTREDIHTGLAKEGGWSEVDLNEAFRTVIPMQGSVSLTVKSKLSKGKVVGLIITILILVGGVSWWFYKPQVASFLDGGVIKVQEISVNSWNYLTNSFKKISFPSFDFSGIFGTKKAPDVIPSVVPVNNL